MKKPVILFPLTIISLMIALYPLWNDMTQEASSALILFGGIFSGFFLVRIIMMICPQQAGIIPLDERDTISNAKNDVLALMARTCIEKNIFPKSDGLVVIFDKNIKIIHESSNASVLCDALYQECCKSIKTKNNLTFYQSRLLHMAFVQDRKHHLPSLSAHDIMTILKKRALMHPAFLAMKP